MRSACVEFSLRNSKKIETNGFAMATDQQEVIGSQRCTTLSVSFIGRDECEKSLNILQYAID